MALVAYSDDSDLGSDSEENVNDQSEVKIKKAENEKARAILVNSSTLPITSQKPAVSSGINDIIDEDEDENYPGNGPRASVGLLASIPAAVPLNQPVNVGLEESEIEDELTDVPTVDTWKITADLKKGGTDAHVRQQLTESRPKSKSSFVPLKKEKSKVKFIIPALSEFDDDDDEEEPKEEPERKKVKPSAQGTGLFSVLPEPKHISVKETKRALIPYILTKAPQVQKPSKPKPAVVKKTEVVIDSDEEDAGPSDFFSLTESPADLGAVATMPVPVVNTVLSDVHVGSPHLSKVEDTIEDANYKYEKQIPAEFAMNVQPVEGLPHSFQSQLGPSENLPDIDKEAMIRLMGKRRGKGEAINFINVSADDALLTRDEWMTKALSEEKPTHSFSKKKEGLPSQKQKQKHQITYLAHQAKERELELKNNWAQNRMTKMQTQAKYGF